MSRRAHEGRSRDTDSRFGQETGLAATELAILMPFILVLLLVVTFAGSAMRQNSRTQTAADAAARAASFFTEESADAEAAARAAAAQACGGPERLGPGQIIDDFVEADLYTFRPGRVVVKVSCIEEYDSLVPFRGVSDRIVTARSVAAIEYWRPEA